MKNDENLDAGQVVNLVQQSLCAIGSAFQSLDTHCHKRFQGCLTKEFRSLADNQPNKSKTTLSPWLFGSNLEEQVKSKVGHGWRSWGAVGAVAPPVFAKFLQNLPFLPQILAFLCLQPPHVPVSPCTFKFTPPSM